MTNYNRLFTTVLLMSAITPALAWDVAGTGGATEITGRLIPQGNDKTWEVEINPTISNLGVPVKKGTTSATLTLTSAIPLLGIRTTSSSTQIFGGGPGLAPQINFGGAINTDDFVSGKVPLVLKVLNAADDSELGTMSVPFTAAANSSLRGPSTGSVNEKFQVFAGAAGDAFFGGLPKVASKTHSDAVALATALNAGHGNNYNDQSAIWATSAKTENYRNTTYTYSGFYSSGIENGAVMTFTLSSAMGADVINWKASLPIVISYQ